jgi:hypothetical protein
MKLFRILALSALTATLVALCACGNGIDKLPGTGSSGGALSVQFAQAPPASLNAGQSVGIVANVVNDTKNGGVTWSCAPAGACGSFNPSTTGYSITTLYTAPMNLNGPITPNLGHSVTITATSVSDSTQSATVTITNIYQQYAFSLESYGAWGMVGSVVLDGNGNILSGEADVSTNLFYNFVPSITGTYALDSSGHGYISMTLNNTPCCGTFQQTLGMTAVSNSHLIIAEEDQFNGFTVGGIGSMDLQSAGPGFSAAQLTGGYSFTLTGYDGAQSFNGSWGGVFSADGVGTISGGMFDTSLGSGLVSVPFTGTFTAPDASGRGSLIFQGVNCPPPPATTCNPAAYAYYLVTPEVLRLTTENLDSASPPIVSTSFAGNSGTAFGQGSVATTNAALSGSFIFRDFGFTSTANGGEQGAAAGQFTTDGNGNFTAGIMDLNAFGTVSTLSLAGATYNIAGSPRGTIKGPSGQTYNVYLTDPNLNLLDPNNTAGTGGALLLETDAANMIGIVIPQTDATAVPSGSYGIFLSDQASPPDSDGGFTGQFTVSTMNAGTFSGEGDFQGTGQSNATPIVGPLSGTFSADSANPGRFTSSITTAPAFPTAAVGDTTPGTENVSIYMANGSQGFIVETDSIAPVFGGVEAQGTIQSRDQMRKRSLGDSSHHSRNSSVQHSEVSRRSR